MGRTLCATLVFGMIGIVTTGIVSIYGILNARIIHTTRVDVEIKKLPEFWEGKKIIHISDVHIGHILRSSFVGRIVKKLILKNQK